MTDKQKKYESLADFRHRIAHPELMPDADEVVEYNAATKQFSVTPRQGGKGQIFTEEMLAKMRQGAPRAIAAPAQYLDQMRYHQGDVIDTLRYLNQGTVIRWQMGHFMYVAIKIRDDWYTSSTDLNLTVPQKLHSQMLAGILQNLPFAVATGWELANEPPF